MDPRCARTTAMAVARHHACSSICCLGDRTRLAQPVTVTALHPVCGDFAAAMMMRYLLRQTGAPAGGFMDRNRMFKLMSLLLMIVVGACVLNFIVYLAGTMVLGGDALNHGSVSNGHFYIKSHGRTKEVTAVLFEYSRWQASTLKITQPVFVAAFIGTLLVRVYAKK